MLKPSVLAAALAVAVTVPAVALAQESAPDTTAPSAALKIDTALNSVESLLGAGLTFAADPSEDATWTAKATTRVKGRTITVAKSIRTGAFSDQSGGLVEATIPRTSDRALKPLRTLRRGKKLSVTLTVVLKDAAGNSATVKKTVKLKKRY